MFDLMPYAFLGFFLMSVLVIIVMALLFSLVKGIYTFIKDTGEKPAQDYLKVSEEIARLKEEYPEVYGNLSSADLGVAVRNTDTVANPNNIELNAHRVMKKHQEKRTNFGKILVIAILSSISTLVVAGGAFTLWLFW